MYIKIIKWIVKITSPNLTASKPLTSNTSSAVGATLKIIAESAKFIDLDPLSITREITPSEHQNNQIRSTRLKKVLTRYIDFNILKDL